jgi:hypothetical protein
MAKFPRMNVYLCIGKLGDIVDCLLNKAITQEFRVKSGRLVGNLDEVLQMKEWLSKLSIRLVSKREVRSEPSAAPENPDRSDHQ